MASSWVFNKEKKKTNAVYSSSHMKHTNMRMGKFCLIFKERGAHDYDRQA
jgi:hypothetical protein